MEKVVNETEKSIVNAIRINEKEVGDLLNRLDSQSVQGTNNSLLVAEADAPYVMLVATRSQDRLNTCVVSYKQKLMTMSARSRASRLSRG